MAGQEWPAEYRWREAERVRDQLVQLEVPRPREVRSGLGVLPDALGLALQGPLLPDGLYFTSVTRGLIRRPF